MDNSNRCRHHGGKSTGPKTEEGKKKVRQNAVKHGLHTSAERFFEDAPQRHLDTYYAYHEALCGRYERAHGSLDYAIKKDLSEVAFEMSKLDMAKEYEKENAVDPEKPITEENPELTSEGVFKKEEVSKVESLKTDIRRENRLLLKDLGIYASPEKQAAEATETLAEVLSED